MSSATKISKDLYQELKNAISGEVRFDEFSKVLYSTDASIYQMDPIGVVIPKNKGDVSTVIDIARKNNLPIVPRCAGTSLAGQAINHGIVIDFSKYMNGIVEVNPEEGWAKVEPGVVLDDLNRHLNPMGLKYAPDPATSDRSCVGGSIGNNTCGSHSVIYGKTIDHVTSVDVILSDGTETTFSAITGTALNGKKDGLNLEAEIYRSIDNIVQENRQTIISNYPKIMRRVSGYNLDDFLDPSNINLTKMVVGSEGTLCVVTEAKINLVTKPKLTGLAIVHFADVPEACDATPEILKHQPSAIELIGKMILERTMESLGFSRNLNFLEGRPGSILIVEFSAESNSELTGKLDSFKSDIQKRKLGYACVNILDPLEQSNVWSVRKAGVGLLMSMRGDSKPIPFVEDTAVDPSQLGEYVRRFDTIVKSYGTEAGYYGHASVGCMHIRPIVNLKDRAGITTMESIASEIGDLVKEFGGSLSGEHGDGIVRGVWTEKMFGSTIYKAFHDIKRAFDPIGIMNPGKIIDCPPMIDNLRYGPNYQVTVPSVQMDFSSDHGYDGAIEMCNGMGACRKMGGTMCPSYMVTKEEEHSTRGRANLLRAVLSGKLSHDSLTSKRLYEALDLCLECKGCKAECPSSVDMAKLKYEFLHNYYKANPITLRTRLFANTNTLFRMGSMLAPFSNWISAIPGIRLLIDVILGIDRHRPLPVFAPTSLNTWFKTREPLSNGSKGPVVLLNDTFMNYNIPQVGVAAVEVLEKAGFRVILANGQCCGRPMISKGLLDAARENAQYNVSLLEEYVNKGIPIIGCEPSCLLTLRDEYPDLLGTPSSKNVAENSYMIEEFLSKLLDNGELELKFTDASKKVLFHGHCHQKALIGTKDSIRILDLPPNYKVEEIKSGCCGMTGSFGFEKEHYNISMAIGNQVLFPAIQSKDESWTIAITGISCRQQIDHGTNKKPQHVIEILHDALA